MKRYLSNEKGVTLLELLATLVISTLLIGITFGVLTSSVTYNKKTQSHVNLRQEANIIITNLRSLHQEGKKLCYEDLLSNDVEIEMLPESDITNCMDSSINESYKVLFKLKDAQNHNEFVLDTVLEGREISLDNSIVIKKPDALEETFFEYLKNNNIFVYGSYFGVSGSSPVNTSENGLGTILINNLNKSNLEFPGNNRISVKNIFIDKSGNDVKFTSSTHLGMLNKTEIVHIKGNVQLNNGGARIFGDTIFIDGNVNFNDSAIIEGKKVIITGNVTFGNWSAQIKADEIYIAGTVTTRQPENLIGTQKNFSQLADNAIPANLNLKTPSLREDSWYPENGYEVRTSGTLSNGSKIFSPSSFTVDSWHSNRSNVIIISKGDISINNFGSSQLTGILFAPNGKVKFAGGSFRGVVIARDGFDTGQNPSITFTNVGEFISDLERVPFY